MKNLYFYIVVLFVSVAIFVADVPEVMIYQGVLIDNANNKPVQGFEIQNFKVVFRKSSDLNATVILQQEIKNVLVENGVFTLHIPVPISTSTTTLFDEPYTVDVLIANESSGGKLGTDVLKVVPYTFYSHNSLKLGGIAASDYATSSHVHSTPNTHTFRIDGSGQIGSQSDQFVIKNTISGASVDVFTVNEDGLLTSQGSIKSSSNVLADGGISLVKDINVVDANNTVLNLTSGGDILGVNDTRKGSVSVQGTMTVSGQLARRTNSIDQAIPSTQTFNGPVSMNGPLIFNTTTGSESKIVFSGSSNVVGESHTLENHDTLADTSVLQTKLTSLINNPTFDANVYHTHELQAGYVTDFIDNTINTSEISDGSLVNNDFLGANPANFAVSDLIVDTKLATISTPGKIATSAFPAELIQKAKSNIFGSSEGFINNTLIQFDATQSKTSHLVSTAPASDLPIFPILDVGQRTNSFSLKLNSKGFMYYSHAGSSNQTGFEIQSDSSKTYIRGSKLVFDTTLDTSIFTGSVIEDGTITTSDLLTYDGSNISSSQQKAKFVDLTVKGEDIADLAITTALFFDDIDSSKIQSNAVTTADLRDKSGQLVGLATANFANKSITNAKITTTPSEQMTTTQFKNLTVTALDLSSDAITSGKISNGAIQTSDLASASVTSGKIKLADLTNAKLSTDVIRYRTAAMTISTTNSDVMTLYWGSLHNANIPSYRFIYINKPVFTAASDGSAAIELESLGKRVFSINNNGSISLSYNSAGAVYPVTLTVDYAAGLVGASTSLGYCGYNHADLVPLNSATGKTFDCISRANNHINLPDMSYINASQTCRQNGFAVCNMGQLQRACALDKLTLNEVYMSSDLVSNTNAATFTQTTAGAGCGTANFTIGSVTSTTASNFMCCTEE
ncbi:MAG: hypothetical protein KC646_15235 [Candidatus Cloacimonetes bacterium]|nr:hypothetical protein [Candidatus Cloacimonadota bacterium]